MYVYRTPKFNNKVELYGLQERIEDLCVELETHRIDQVQAKFERVYPYLKRRILNRRLIARILRVDNEQFLCFVEIFKRGDNDYEQFLDDPRKYGRTHLEPQLNLTQIRDWLTRETSKQPSVHQLPELSPELRPWLEPPGWEIDTLTEDWLIYESEEWVKRFRQREIQNAWETYYQLVLGIRGGTHAFEGLPDWSNLKLCSLNNHYVLFSEMETADTFIGKVLFLLAPFNRRPSTDEIIHVGKKTALFDDNNRSNLLARPLKLHELTPFAERSYPSYLLADEESWLAIERGKEANLALSIEEEQILQSVSIAAPGQGSLPLFINGRAGSGKSTMLLYLFADYCYRKYYDQRGQRRDQPLPGEPLFLTYNQRLLEVARDGVNTLLASHYRFVAERNQGENRENIDRFFQPFQKFLFSLLPPQERLRFDPEKYIGFHRFKQIYQGKNICESLAKVVLHLPQARRYSPETSWHVIRSFIKGYGLEEYMSPEDYQQEVPRKEHTVSVEKFQGIYDTIWERWYKRITSEQGYWDDQDLIAKVLSLKCYRPEYTAIFCDEAQDFTRLELQLIMQLSMFSQYHLGYQPIHSLPFAFAGDPFQTLNPTGFHWSSVQAIFDAEVITALDPADQLKLVINFQELSNNYRSTPPIVQVTNLIQLWRHVLFNISELKPQTAWQQGNFPEPQKFIINQNITAEELADYIKDTIIIVPCEEGEEAAYAQADEILSEFFTQLKPTEPGEKETLVEVELEKVSNSQTKLQNLKSPEPLKNVLSAITAKGLEFKKVILYKFGEECNQNVWNSSGKGIDQRVKVEYFFNKLYVAASRATERLFVVDSEQGDRQLWQYASDEALLQVMLNYAKNKEDWEENVRTISTGNPKTVQELREDNPDAIAYEFETKGLNSQNPDLLKRARQFYIDLGDTNKVIFCEAWALKFEENFLEAGNCFFQLGNFDEAWVCFWEGMCWSELASWYKMHPENQTVERSIVNFMIAAPRNLEAINNFTSLIRSQGLFPATTSNSNENSEKPQTTDNAELTHHKQWKKAIEDYANRIEGLLNVSDLKPEQWQHFGEAVKAVEAYGNIPLHGCSEFKSLAAECFYRGEKYEKAIRIWEECDLTQKPEYNLAKAKLLDIPERLEYLAQVGEQDSIISEWEKMGKPRTLNWLPYVAPALEIKQQYQQAFVVYIWLDELAKVKECFEKANQGVHSIKQITVLLQYFYRKKHWTEAIEAIEKYLPNISGSSRQKWDLKFDFIYEIACSDLTPNDLTKEHRKLYDKFLKEQVLSTSDWREYLLMQQVGVALEKIGSLVETLEFYEQFVSHTDSELRQFAQNRWIATKKKQEEYARTHGQIDKATKSHSEMLKKADSWSISPDSVPQDFPSVPKTRPTPQVSQSAVTQLQRTLTTHVLEGQSASSIATKFIIKGLPNGTKIEQLGDGVIRFGVRHLIIKVMRQSKQVLITDALNSREVRVDGGQCKVTFGEATVEAGAGGNQLVFALTTSDYRGELICDAKKPGLELTVQGLPNKIYIDL